MWSNIPCCNLLTYLYREGRSRLFGEAFAILFVEKFFFDRGTTVENVCRKLFQDVDHVVPRIDC